MAAANKYFLPYQQAWLNDKSRFKIFEKTRRGGMTYVQSYEDVRDCARQNNPLDVWFSSADESAAAEYIRYCADWAQVFKIAADDLGETVIDREKDIKALSIQFSSGKRINALSSNPKAFRSKGGKLVLDEFAFHAQPEEMWKAAIPIITWGYPVRVISTHNGKGQRYYRIIDDTKKELAKTGRSRWSLHRVTIEQAVEQGLADRIVSMSLIGRVSNDATLADLERIAAEASMNDYEVADDIFNEKIAEVISCRGNGATLRDRIRTLVLSNPQRKSWLEELHDAAADEEAWQQEYMCNPVDESTAWLPWSLITSVENPDAGKPELYQGGPCYIGMDIGRRRDLTVIWVIEKVGDILWTREVVTMKNAKFKEQDAELARVFSDYDVKRCCMDQSGMGEKPVEDAKDAHGQFIVEGVIFSNVVKQSLAQNGKQHFEDRLLRTPESRSIRESHHSVRKITTAAGNPRFDAERTEVGHADEFWAHMLAIEAANDSTPPPAGATVQADNQDTYAPQAGSGRRRLRLGATQ